METKTERFNIVKVPMDICYDYQPEESMIMYDENGEGYPGANEIIEINTIHIGGHDCTELLESQMRQIEQEVLNDLNKKRYENNF
jgi:hypothetical protein